ncbi:MAG: TRAP transporter large permease [Granulosicoccaceae bacterium]
MLTALIGFVVLIALILGRVPIALAMGLVGFFGFAVERGLGFDNFFDFKWRIPLSMVSSHAVYTAREYGLSVIPLFILMGNLVGRSGLAGELYKAAYAWLGHKRGGLAMSTVLACGGFSAICGSSLATAATMSRVAIGPMREFRYADSLASASIAAGATLGILIPPSVILIIYGVFTETSIRELFAAGVFPGLMGILLYLVAVRFTVWRDPKAGPPGAVTPKLERWKALSGVSGVLVLFILVMGGIYAGVFTPTEAAGIGAGGAFLIALYKRCLTMSILMDILRDTVRTSAMLFGILIGALALSSFVTRTGFPQELGTWLANMDVSPLWVIAAMMLVYVVLGMLLESLSMLLLTLPVFFPVVQALGLDPVWFGIVVVVVTEISLITPPVGLNVFVLSATVPDISTKTIFKGVTPFWAVDIIRLVLLILIPSISLWLPIALYR